MQDELAVLQSKEPVMKLCAFYEELSKKVKVRVNQCRNVPVDDKVGPRPMLVSRRNKRERGRDFEGA